MPQYVTAPHSRWMRRACTTVGVVTVFAVWGMFVGRFVLHGPVTSERLAWSVMGKTGSAGWLLGSYGSCELQSQQDRWSCYVLDSGGSGDVEYAVKMKPDSSCWTARLASESGEVMPNRASGCISLFSLVVLH